MQQQDKHNFQLKSLSNKLRHFTLYETDQRFYLVGSDVAKKHYKLMKIEKMSTLSNELQITEDAGVYNSHQMNELLTMIKSVNPKQSDNNNVGFVVRVAKAHGIVGFIRFTQGYYLILITDKREVGTIANHFVYEIADTAVIPLFQRTVQTGFFKLLRSRDEEQRYTEIFTALDLTKDFYFSYTYDIANSLQHNMRDYKKGDHKSMFEWNSFLLKPLAESVEDRIWLLPIIHGYFNQTKISVFGKLVNIVLVGRRSRYFAGTRYLKRGISDSGHVANHVETEQIVYDENSLLDRQSQGAFSSLVQTRGSIPVYWSQTISTKVVDPKPEIMLGKFDPLYLSSAKHFDYLMERHGYPVCCLDLVKTKEKKPREQILGSVYRTCVDYLNKNLPAEKQLKYTSWDFKNSTKDKPEKALNELAAFAEENLEQTGFFCSRSEVSPDGYSLQKGVLRTNCIDCLDRTNIVQFFIGKYALGQQLYALGVTDSPHLVYYSNVVKILMKLYDGMGDKIALQYGGSRTVSVGINHRGYSWDFVTSLKRYYSNNFKDELRQHAMNLFLGNFVPNSHSLLPIWNLDTDAYLHDNDKSDSIECARHDSELNKEERTEKFFEELYNPFTVTDFNQMPSHFKSTVDLYLPTKKKRKGEDSSTPSPASSPRSVSSKESTDTESFTSASHETKDVESLSDHVFPEIESQGELLRKFEGKMDSLLVVNSNLFPDDKFLTRHWRDMVGYQNEISTLSKLFTQKQEDLDLYNHYTEEAHPASVDTQRHNIQYKDVLVSQNSTKNQRVYEDYIKNSTKENPSRSEVLARDYATYQRYTSASSPFSDLEQTQEQYKSLIHESNQPETKQETNTGILTFPQSHYSRLEAYFPNIKHDRQEISKRISYIAQCMRKEMVIVDRVRHPKPAKKYFAQLSLFELLKGRLYRKCFLGCRAIDWIIKNSGREDFIETKIDTRASARDFLQILLDCYVFHHVAFAKVFLDGHYLYKFSVDDPTRVLNMHDLQMSESRAALTISEDALERITDIYRTIFNAQSRSVDLKTNLFFDKLTEQSKTIVGTSIDYAQFIQVVEELQRVDLQIPPVERLCFFLNIYCVLTLHGLLIMGGSSRSRVYGLATYGFFRRTCYQIGGFRFSLSDIRDGILRNNRPYPGSHTPTFGCEESNGLQADMDPRLALCINPQDVRILFLLHKIDAVWNPASTIRIPKASFMEPQTSQKTKKKFVNIFSSVNASNIEQILQETTDLYCIHNIVVQQPEVKLPSFFGLFAEDFGGSDEAIVRACINILSPNCYTRSVLMTLYSEDPAITELKEKKTPVIEFESVLSS